MEESSPRPVIASFVPVFLKPEMLHVYRQVTGLQCFHNLVLTHKIENASAFPLDLGGAEILRIPKARTHELRRFYYRRIAKAPVQIYPGEARRMGDLLSEKRVSLLHIYFGHAGVYLLPLIRCWPGPVAVSFHGADGGVDLDRTSFRAAMERMVRVVDGLLVRSEELRSQLKELGADEKRIFLNHTSLPEDAFPFVARQLPVNGEWHLVQACRLIEKKGLPQTLRVFARFRQGHPGARLTIAGEGPMREELRELAAELGIGAGVRFAGFLAQEELRQLYESAHLFIHPSFTTEKGDREGIPNSLIEAMASGLPVLATRHGGIPEAVTDGKSGRLVPERDEAALFEALLELTRSPGIYASMGVTAAKAARETFGAQRQIGVLEDFYKRLIRQAAEREKAASQTSVSAG